MAFTMGKGPHNKILISFEGAGQRSRIISALTKPTPWVQLGEGVFNTWYTVKLSFSLTSWSNSSRSKMSSSETLPKIRLTLVLSLGFLQIARMIYDSFVLDFSIPILSFVFFFYLKHGCNTSATSNHTNFSTHIRCIIEVTLRPSNSHLLTNLDLTE